ncbi:BTB/POZ domain-containing adapter for CUL3-mediated RhoA degradation protein 3-like [Daktulosphaira vitifoliae]|uniref:BTB/POZ domain-containing adapter for CUL3-mediated RhoA degradation protein 3-like n=1 Tax=Daktulosphaira vitifoliae TaxID=58002 RepID=UPI0021AA1D3E|nr:BTB/POZ domain-containing adapter for CUL3-mediated RhoA degradation protein 3-like [Daktulosphaira vitifoliae]
MGLLNETKQEVSNYVKLNIGGSLFYTTVTTLTKLDSKLRELVLTDSGNVSQSSESEGWTFIDRCGKHFGTILNFLRDGSVPLPASCVEISEILAEAKYYGVVELSEACEQALQKKRNKNTNITWVTLTTSQNETQKLISVSSKPVVKFAINRHNNKYSYTGASDDNLLKNIELFDKLAEKHRERGLFIKDVIGSNEICCWTFYGPGGAVKKVAEVCCTSIVYATDKKHTKVDFPETRILEETMNVMLLDTRANKSIQENELIEATSSSNSSCHCSCSSQWSDTQSNNSIISTFKNSLSLKNDL